MATHSFPRKGEDEQSQAKNIICCLQFLANEAVEAQLPDIAKILSNTLTKIMNLNTSEHGQDIDLYFAELVTAFKEFVKFYLLGNKANREELIDLINKMDRERLEAYVY